MIKDILDPSHHYPRSDRKITPTTFNDLKTPTEGQERTPFIYTPLPAGTYTRLITLLPGDGQSPIEFLLTPTNLSKKPKYEALSYVWGKVDAAYGILLNGQRFQVGENLWLALYRLRHMVNSQTFWIDAISINQNDEAEKAIQIRQMGNIYSQASTVLAWLGDQLSKHIDDAFTVMEILHGNIPSKIRGDWQLFSPSRLQEDPTAAVALTETCTDFIEIAVAVLRAYPDSPRSMRLILSTCPYWGRLWIIQEVLLAKKLVLCCGTRRFSWKIYSDLRPLMCHLLTLTRAQPYLGEGTNLSEISMAFDVHTAAKFDKLRQERIKDRDTQREYDLRGLLNMSLSAECYTPRNRIYGWLGVVNVPNISVDYDRPMFEVFTDTLQHIKHAGVRGKDTLFDFYTIRFAQLMQALLHGPFSDTPKRSLFFRICGFQTGTIKSIDTTCTTNDDFNVTKAKLEDLFENYPSAARGIPFTKDFFDNKGRYARLEALMYAREYNLPPPHEISPMVSKTASIYESKCMDAIHSWNPSYFKAIAKPYSTAKIMQKGSSLNMPPALITIDKPPSLPLLPPKFFLTTTLSFGLCPESTLPGDIVVQFLNSDTAAILRPSASLEGGTQYRFIGRAFVGRDGGVDATMQIIGTPNNDTLKKHGSIMTEDEVAKRGLTSCVEMVVDAATLQHLTARIDWWTGGLRESTMDFDDFMQG